jgi:hypothetical protein
MSTFDARPYDYLDTIDWLNQYATGVPRDDQPGRSASNNSGHFALSVQRPLSVNRSSRGPPWQTNAVSSQCGHPAQPSSSLLTMLIEYRDFSESSQNLAFPVPGIIPVTPATSLCMNVPLSKASFLDACSVDRDGSHRTKM